MGCNSRTFEDSKAVIISASHGSSTECVPETTRLQAQRQLMQPLGQTRVPFEAGGGPPVPHIKISAFNKRNLHLKAGACCAHVRPSALHFSSAPRASAVRAFTKSAFEAFTFLWCQAGLSIVHNYIRGQVGRCCAEH